MVLRERIQAAMDAKGWNQARLAAESGVAEETLSKIMTGATEDPQMSTLTRLAYALDETVGALLGEKGFDLTAADQQRVRDFIAWAARKLEATPPPLIDAFGQPNASSLDLIAIGERRRRSDPKSGETGSIPAHFWEQGAKEIFRANGDSMRGAGILDRDLLYVKRVGVARMAAGKIVVCRVGNKQFVKKLEIARGKVRLLSANDRYAPIEVKKEDLEVVGVVIGRSGPPAP
ncbi:MAG TPA: S24 family peptidase [Thermoanaerobaculia bacterium]|nr:S24 family peptidase [Thermoanaerobaculia bacterium]